MWAGSPQLNYASRLILGVIYRGGSLGVISLASHIRARSIVRTSQVSVANKQFLPFRPTLNTSMQGAVKFSLNNKAEERAAGVPVRVLPSTFEPRQTACLHEAWRGRVRGGVVTHRKLAVGCRDEAWGSWRKCRLNPASGPIKKQAWCLCKSALTSH